MLYHFMEALYLLMVCVTTYCLQCCWRCRVFWIIQAFGLVELLWLYAYSYDVHTYYSIDQLNLALELVVAYVTVRHFPFVSILSSLHGMLKVFDMTDAIKVSDMTSNVLNWTRYWLNEVILLVILGYAIRRAMLRLEEKDLCPCPSLKNRIPSRTLPRLTCRAIRLIPQAVTPIRHRLHRSK